MAHHHNIGDTHSHNTKSIQKTLILSICLIGFFTIVEYIGGYLSKSLALTADASHMLTDFAALWLALLGLTLSQKVSTSKKSYGYARAEILMSLINAVFLLAICLYIVYESILRFYNEIVIDPTIVLPIAIIGLVINLMVMYLLHKSTAQKHNHSHHSHNHHGHSHNNYSNNMLLQSASLHVITDTLGSVITIIVAITIYYTNWYLIDPILSILLVSLILKGVWSIIKESVHILMEGSPRHLDTKEIEHYIKENITNIIDIHHIHLWSLNQTKTVITLHVVLENLANHNNIVEDIKELLNKKFNITHATIQIEAVNSPCLNRA